MKDRIEINLKDYQPDPVQTASALTVARNPDSVRTETYCRNLRALWTGLGFRRGDLTGGLRVPDTALAEALGYSEVKKLRNLIRAVKSPLFTRADPEQTYIDAGHQGRGRKAVGYLLSVEQAARVAMEATTPQAGLVKDAMAALIGDLVNGRLQGMTLLQVDKALDGLEGVYGSAYCEALRKLPLTRHEESRNDRDLFYLGMRGR